ncbi:hypothetical protein C8F04DRAFT_1187505 [Mycena alexandri]|uniref:Uncharacterized protein n=1 Tax=Mycena alexandri TaxID=1745969 RepID=A0AAD6SKK5_9AGAR|nr:hypothetical protein C8F04DRAFT_1187505 [Mycena alexandri]
MLQLVPSESNFNRWSAKDGSSRLPLWALCRSQRLAEENLSNGWLYHSPTPFGLTVGEICIKSLMSNRWPDPNPKVGFVVQIPYLNEATASSAQPPRPYSHFPAVPAGAIVPVPVGTTSARRTASALHSLPQHQGLVANASAPHRGPRHPYPEHVSQASASASNTAYGPSPTSTETLVSVLIWPFVASGGNAPAAFGTPTFKIRSELLLNYITAFDLHGLYFHHTVPSTDLVSAQDFTCKLYTHLSNANLQLTLAPGIANVSTIVPFNQQPFVVLEASRYREITTFKPCSTMNDNTFSLATFKKLNKRAPNPNPDQRYRLEPLFAICARFDHIRGAITHRLFAAQDLPPLGRDLAHPGDNAGEVTTLHPYPKSPSLTARQDTLPVNHLAVAGPPSALNNSRPATPPNGPSLIRQRSPTSQGDPAGARRVRPRPDQTPVPFTVVPLVQGTDVAFLSDVTRWENFVRLSTGDRAANPISIAGESIDAVAECLLRLILLIWERKDSMPETFTLPEKVSQVLQPFACPGPLRAMFRTAAKCLSTQHRFWKPLASSAFIVPNLGLIRDNPPAKRLTTFRAHGSFLALHCAVLGHGPLPISIWLLLALVLGKKAMLIPKNLLLYLDPAAYDVLAPWYDFHQHTPVPPASMPTHPLRLFMINVLDRQPSEIDNVRTKEEHEAWVVMAFAMVLLGDAAPFSHADFSSILRGFNLALGERGLVEVHSHIPNVCISSTLLSPKTSQTTPQLLWARGKRDETTMQRRFQAPRPPKQHPGSYGPAEREMRPPCGADSKCQEILAEPN